MSTLTRLLVAHSDPRVAQALRFGFERAGGATHVDLSDDTAHATSLLAAAGGESAPQVVIAGAGSGGEALDLLAALRRAQAVRDTPVPILYLGSAIGRQQARQAGASAVLSWPAFLRDVVTVAQLLASPKRNSTTAFRGSLADYDGVYYLIRATIAVGRSAILSMVRGLRRGEVRFYKGEVTSAQVGMLHGLAALHQLLLWTQANFELRQESVVRRQQIPLEPSELLRDAQRFLGEIRAVGSSLELADIYAPVPAQVKAASVPGAVRGILQLMDGQRTLADVIEDSPFRLFDTLRVTNRLAEIGLIAQLSGPLAAGGSHPALMVDEWLVGSHSSGIPAVVTDEITPNTSPTLSSRHVDGVAASIDWSAILPTSLSADPGVSQVVPSAEAAGEIVVRTRADDEDAGADDAGADDAGADDAGADDAGVADAGADRADANRADADPADADADPRSDEPAGPGRDRAAAGDTPPDVDPSSAGPREGLERITDAEARDRLFSTHTAQAGQAGSNREPAEDEPMPKAEKPSDGGEDAGSTAASGPQTPSRGDSPPRKAPRASSPQFTEDEEAFFREGARLADAPVQPAESFEDLDVGYTPQTFWQRLFGRGGKRSPAANGAGEPAPKQSSKPAPKQSSKPAPKQPPKQPPEQPSKPASRQPPELAPQSLSQPAPEQPSRPASESASGPARGEGGAQTAPARPAPAADTGTAATPTAPTGDAERAGAAPAPGAARPAPASRTDEPAPAARADDAASTSATSGAASAAGSPAKKAKKGKKSKKKGKRKR